MLDQMSLSLALVDLKQINVKLQMLTCSGGGVWCRPLGSQPPARSPQLHLHRAEVDMGWFPEKQWGTAECEGFPFPMQMSTSMLSSADIIATAAWQLISSLTALRKWTFSHDNEMVTYKPRFTKCHIINNENIRNPNPIKHEHCEK